MSVDPASAAGLDWPVVVTAWSERALTPLGAQAVRACTPLASAAEVRLAHDAIQEWLDLADAGVDTGLGAVVDIRKDTDRAARGEVLDDPELQRAGHSLQGLAQVASVFDKVDTAPLLSRVASRIDLDLDVIDLLTTAWDRAGLLSAKRWPQLGELREQINQLHARVRSTLDGLVSGDTLADSLQDRFWTQRERRYVLPLKHHAKGYNLGIVHGTSRTGQTVFVEPHEIVAINNALRVAEGQLQAAEHRVRTQLSAALGTCKEPVSIGIEAATELDLTAARAGLARLLQCTRPMVGDGGAIALETARHPVLALRGIDVVPNDLRLAEDAAALVISGPNAGGKTVALKTVGLCALLVQHGCWVPAAEGSRVDCFGAIWASIGDQQTVEGDLSSFSGHLVTLGRILEHAGPGTLALLDELASGTDPAQGAALAQAVLETLLDRGARLVVTTHYARLKGLAAADPRFEMAATQYVEGNPTYRLLTGTTGESRAFDLARRMGMSEAILGRAESLMDRGDAELAKALESLETERSRAEAQVAELRRLREEIAARELKLAAREAKIKAHSRELEEQGAEAYLDRLKGAEKAIGQVVAQLQSDPSHKGVRAAKASLDALRNLAPTPEVPEPATPAEVQVGDQVRLIRLNKVGEVVARGAKTAKVRAGGLTLTVKLTEIEPTRAAAPPTRIHTPTVALAASELEHAVRMGGNTLDLRGKRFDESTDEAEKFFDRAVLRGFDNVFLLHGHGTGALKSGLRSWLRSSAYVRDWAPASEEQGGDAFTVVRIG